MEITAAVLREGHGPFTIETLALDEPRDDEVLVRMVATGMCHTDLLARELPPELFTGPTVYGHEGAGVVEAVGAAVDKVAPGDHVVLSFNSCGGCVACVAGRRPHCVDFQLYNMSGGRPDGTSSLTDADGGRVASHFFGQSAFASHAVAAAASVVKVDDAHDLARLGPLGCGVQTGAGAVLNTLDVEAGSSLVITGAGALGLSAVMAAVVAGAGTVVAVDRHPSRLELASEYGATHTLSAPPDELADQLRELTGGGADYAFDTTGNAAVVRAAYDGLHNRGTLAMAGIGFGEVAFDLVSMISGRTITGVIEGDSVTETFIPRLAELNAEGRFPFDDLITTFALDEINEAEAASLSGEVIKPVLTFG